MGLACGGKVDDGDAGGNDAAPPPDSSPAVDVVIPPSSDGSPGTCNTLQLLGASITLEQVASSAPPFAGNGAFPQGVFNLTAVTIYTGPNGASGPLSSVQASIQISSAKNGFLVDSVAFTNNSPIERTTSTATLGAAGEVDITPFCPAPGAPTKTSFGFDGKSLTLRFGTTNETIDETYSL